jgi:hypothetical protein
MFLYSAKNHSTGITKIGYSTCANRRVKAFAGFELTFKLKVENEAVARSAENILKNKLKPWLDSGREWFKLPENVSVSKTIELVAKRATTHHEECRILFEGYFKKQESRILKDRSANRKTPEYILRRSRKYRALLIVDHGYDPEQLKEYY